MKNKLMKMLGSTTLLAMAGVTLTVPFNMGGCAEVGSTVGSVGTMMGAPAGTEHVATGLGKAADAARLSDREEDAMGQSVAVAVTNQYPLNENAAQTKYVTLVGLTIASCTTKPDGNWVFGVVDSPDVNAFAGPGGYIMVTSGALKMMENEAELAGVLAHEITHVEQQHGLKAVKQAGYLDALAEGGKAVDNRVELLSPIIEGSIDVVLKKGYSREQETDADKRAVKLVMAAGYDPNAYKAFLQRVRAGQSSGKSNIMSTHPGLDQRIAAVSAGIPAGQTGAQLKDRFAKNVMK